MFRPYTELSDNEWIELEFECYNCDLDEYLGKYPGAEWGNVYSMKGFSSNDLLYVEFYYPTGGTSEYIFLDKELEEPVKWLTIKEIVITKSDDSNVKIVDELIINQLEDVLKNQIGSEYRNPNYNYDNYYEFVDLNTSVYFDVECDLSWKCAIEKRANDAIYLIGYDQKNAVWLEYDVTDLLSGIY